MSCRPGSPGACDEVVTSDDQRPLPDVVADQLPLFARRRCYGGGKGAAVLGTVLLWAGINVVLVVILAGSLLAAMMQYG